MAWRTFFGISAIISLLLAGTYFYFQWKNSPPSGGAGWEVVQDYGKIKMVSVTEENLKCPECMAAILDTLIGPAYEKRQGFFTVFFFDDPAYAPTEYKILNAFNRGEEYPFTPEQLRHLRARYIFTMPFESEFHYIALTQGANGTKVKTYQVDIHPGKLGEQDLPDFSRWRQGKLF